MPEVLDLDELDIQPLPVRVGGKEYMVDLTVGVMRKVAAMQAAEDSSPWVIALAAMEAAGMPRDVFEGLGPKQAVRLSEMINTHFFGDVSTEPEETTTEATEPVSNGPT
jgi:hypothetical protein